MKKEKRVRLKTADELTLRMVMEWFNHTDSLQEFFEMAGCVCDVVKVDPKTVDITRPGYPTYHIPRTWIDEEIEEDDNEFDLIGERIMNVKHIILEWLIEHEYDGLYTKDCGCALNDLIPCEESCINCKAGYKRKPTPEELAGEWPEEEYMIGPLHREAADEEDEVQKAGIWYCGECGEEYPTHLADCKFREEEPTPEEVNTFLGLPDDEEDEVQKWYFCPVCGESLEDDSCECGFGIKTAQQVADELNPPEEDDVQEALQTDTKWACVTCTAHDECQYQKAESPPVCWVKKKAPPDPWPGRVKDGRKYRLYGLYLNAVDSKPFEESEIAQYDPDPHLLHFRGNSGMWYAHAEPTNTPARQPETLEEWGQVAKGSIVQHRNGHIGRVFKIDPPFIRAKEDNAGWSWDYCTLISLPPLEVDG